MPVAETAAASAGLGPLGIIGIGASILGAGASIYGSNRAADAAEDAAEESAAIQRAALQTQLALTRPGLEVGQGALSVLASLYGLPQPTGIDFDGLSGGIGSGGRSRQYRGRAGFEQATQGLAPLAGATWRGRPVFTDGQGGLYTSRGRDATVGSAGVEYLGQAGEGPAGTRFDGTRVRAGTGILDYRDGQFFAGRGNRAQQIGFEMPEPLPAVEDAASPGATPGSVPAGLNLNDLVANNPFIQYQQEQGEQAIDRAAAARGLNASGGTLQDFARFNQGLASTGIQNFVLNPLMQLAGFGPQAAAQAGSAIGNTSQNLSNLALQSGNVRASAFQNTGNTLGNLISGIGGYFGNRQTGLAAPPSLTTGGATMPGSPFYVPPPSDPFRV